MPLYLKHYYTNTAIYSFVNCDCFKLNDFIAIVISEICKVFAKCNFPLETHLWKP